jgi:predicted N-formylglutamate amidohydrolase
MHDIASPDAGHLIASRVSESAEILGGSAALGVVLLCDHASNALPSAYGTLGLADAQLRRHIAYDIGAAGVTRRLSRLIGAPAVLSCWSRLLIDCNRGADDPTLIMRISDGAVVPGNRILDTGERERRIAAYYEPYHSAVAHLIDRCMGEGLPPLLISVHSFTPFWRGAPRPWHAGILWDRDDRAARPLIEALSRDPALVIGDNQPYSGRLRGDTMWRHGTMRGLSHAIVEIRQDLIEGEQGQAAWAERLAEILMGFLACPVLRPSLGSVRYFGSHTD